MSEFDHDMIARYLDGEMNEAEKKSFEDEILQNEELRNEVELTREVNDTLRFKLYEDENEEALRSTLSEISHAYFTSDAHAKPKAKVVMMRRNTWLAAAATVIVLMILLTIWSPWKKDLYQQYASIEMPPVAERGDAKDSLLKAASINFNKKNFRESIPLFESILKSDSSNSFVRFYYGIALLETDQKERSRSELLHLYQGTSFFKYEGAFFIALSYLKENNKVLCKEWLDKIPVDTDLSGKVKTLKSKL